MGALRSAPFAHKCDGAFFTSCPNLENPLVNHEW